MRRYASGFAEEMVVGSPYRCKLSTRLSVGSMRGPATSSGCFWVMVEGSFRVIGEGLDNKAVVLGMSAMKHALKCLPL
eukprot:7384710-Pyramimonas_sp.AAC.1